nr:peptidylprolyl isomerase [Gemmatimonadaceae bacterium]
MKRSSLALLVLGATTLVACDGLKAALNSHVDVVAKAGSQELSVTRLGDMIGNAKVQIPVTKDVATLIARDLWVPYQLLALAAARGDSLTDAKAIDAAASGMIENAKLQRFMEGVSKTLPSDSAGEPAYLAAKGDLYSARHILFMLPPNATPAQKDSVRKKAAAVRAQVTAANFAEMAKKHSGDNSAAKGGDLGVFPKAMMVKPFGDAVAVLKPGEISPLVETQFGFHIVQRNTWAQAKEQYLQKASGAGRQAAESSYFAQAQAEAKISVKAGAAAAVKELAKDPMAHRSDKTVVASYSRGEVTSGRIAQILMATPNIGQVAQQIQVLPDSMINKMVTNMAQRELLLHRADSAKVGMTPDELARLHGDFASVVKQSWVALGIDPKSLADSAKTP